MASTSAITRNSNQSSGSNVTTAAAVAGATSNPNPTTSSSNKNLYTFTSNTPHGTHFPQQQQRHNSFLSSCSKFVPQAFNTNKCQQCFNLKDVHSLEALSEFTKSNRKVCKYGYLFIAPPDLDLNKTKRWQWRFFIFYDDSELTYSLDENPFGKVRMPDVRGLKQEFVAQLEVQENFCKA